MPYLIFDYYHNTDYHSSPQYTVKLTRHRSFATAHLAKKPKAFTIHVSAGSAAWIHLLHRAHKWEAWAVSPYDALTPEELRDVNRQAAQMSRAITDPLPAEAPKATHAVTRIAYHKRAHDMNRDIRRWQIRGIDLDAMKAEEAREIERAIREGDLDVRVLCWEVGIKEVKVAEAQDEEFGTRMREWRRRGLGETDPLGLVGAKQKGTTEEEDDGDENGKKKKREKKGKMYDPGRWDPGNWPGRDGG